MDSMLKAFGKSQSSYSACSGFARTFYTFLVSLSVYCICFNKLKSRKIILVDLFILFSFSGSSVHQKLFIIYLSL